METVNSAIPSSEIQVYAPFPHTVALGDNLDIDPTNWRWFHCLTFPLETLHKHQFSHKPYKWIRYAIGVVAGMQGHLSLSRDSLEIMDYDDGLPRESVVLYYHTSDEEKRRMFPTDPNIGRTIITSSVTTSQRARFRDGVLERDERRCVLSDMAGKVCDAVHLVAHGKGDVVCYLSLPRTHTHTLTLIHTPSQRRQYILNYTQHRSREPNRNDILSDIDDVRNGLFLNPLTHKALGKDVAFLKVCDDYVVPNHNQGLTSRLDP